MQIGKASGLQIAFFLFAVFLLAVPFSKYLGHQLALNKDWLDPFGRIGQLAILATIIAIAERVKPGVVSNLLLPVPRDRRLETFAVTALKLLVPFAVLGTIMLWHWVPGGPSAVEQRFPTDAIHTASQVYAFSAPGLVFMFAAVTLAPLVEEIAFRGLLYRAWEEAWGWIPAMLLTSIVFALYHATFASAFLSSILFVCLYRRSGTLLAPMIAHAVGNACTWYPLLGQFYFPNASLLPGDLGSWKFHFGCLVVASIAFPLYLALARNEYSRAAR